MCIKAVFIKARIKFRPPFPLPFICCDSFTKDVPFYALISISYLFVPISLPILSIYINNTNLPTQHSFPLYLFILHLFIHLFINLYKHISNVFNYCK